VKENYAKNCSLKQKVNSLEQGEAPSISVLQFLGVVVEAQPTVTQDSKAMKLSYVQEQINEKMTLEMVESGATHNIMREYIAQNLGLQFEQELTSFKTVKSGKQEVGGTSKNAPMNLGE
jgi:hypothetical protein